MNIRCMTNTDFPEIFLLWKKTNLGVKPEEIEKKETFKMIEYNPTTCLVAIENNKIIGTIMGIFDGRRAWIYRLAISPDFQKKGHGSILLKKAEEELKKRGVTIVKLWVFYDNLEILPFYLNNDYKANNNALVLVKEL